MDFMNNDDASVEILGKVSRVKAMTFSLTLQADGAANSSKLLST